jgi:PST family polysaccharide transporter
LFFVSCFAIQPAAILNREMRLVRRAVIECIQSVIGLAVGIYMAKTGHGYWSLVYMQAANSVSGILLSWWSIRWVPSRPRWDSSATRILRFGASLTLSNIATYVSISGDNMIVGAVDGPVALGLYDKAYRLVLQPLSQLSAPIGRVAIPLLSRLNDDAPRYASAFRRMLQLPLLICLPGLLCGIFLSRQLVGVFLGPTWAQIAPVFSWICVGGLVSTIYGSAFWLFTSQGRGRDQMNCTIITSIISVTSFVIGVRWGAVGVACAAAIGFVLIQTPIMMIAATRIGPVTATMVLRDITPLGVACSITAPVLYFYSRVVHLKPILELSGGALLSCSIYLLAICTMPSGRELLSGSVKLASNYFGRVTGRVQSVVA